MNLASWIARAGKAYADRPALGVGDTVVTDYAGLARDVARLAGALRNGLGLSPGDRVAIASQNRTEYVTALFAAWHAGLAAVPVNAKLHGSEFAYILENAGARAVFVSDDLADTIATSAPSPDLRVIVLGSAEWHRLLDADAVAVAETAPDDLAWLFYTSGTTGMPKGAMLSHRNLLNMSLNYFLDIDSIAPGDGILHAAPMSHGSGCYMLPHVAAGAVNVVPESGGFDSDEIYSLFAAWQGLTMFCAPTMVRRLTVSCPDAPAAGLKTIAYGGAPMYVEDCIAALDRFGDRLVQLYGQGESPMTITHLSRAFHADRGHPRWRERLGSVGIAQSCVDVCVFGEDGAPCPPGEPGEIAVRGDVVMKGYWANPQATSEAIRDGWLHTGDVGRFDEDGFLTLTDRSKDVIISGGSNVYPREVEEVLLRHADVEEVSVIGRPDPEWGEVVVAYVVSQAGTDALPGELDALCLSSIARFKRPKDYRFIDRLPKNNYGKVLKTALREIDAGRENA